MELAISTPESTAAAIANTVGTEISVPKTEPIVPVPAVQDHKKDLTSSRFAALAKKETQIVRERAAIKAERESIARDRSDAQKLVDAQKLAMSNPRAAMEALGISYKQLTEFVLNDENPTPELQARSLKEELKSEWQKELEARDKRDQEKQEEHRKQEEEKTRGLFIEQTGEYIRKNKDKYPLINHPKNDFDYALSTVSALIEQHFHNTAEKDEQGAIIKAGKLISVSEASQMYEDYLKDITTEFAATIKPKSEGQSDPKTTAKESVQEPRTITNQMQSGMSTNLPAKTEQDRMRRAMAKLDGQ